jgi:hypothetical protein
MAQLFACQQVAPHAPSLSKHTIQHGKSGESYHDKLFGCLHARFPRLSHPSIKHRPIPLLQGNIQGFSHLITTYRTTPVASIANSAPAQRQEIVA